MLASASPLVPYLHFLPSLQATILQLTAMVTTLTKPSVAPGLPTFNTPDFLNNTMHDFMSPQ